MTTRADIVATVADMLARSDLDTQIGREVERAVEHYNRVGGFAFQEARDGTFSTADGTQWYTSVDFSSGGGSIELGTVDAKNILTIDYARVTQGAGSWPLAVLKYSDFERYSEPTSPEGVPDALTRYAHGIGLWPVPNGTYTVTLSARFKEAIPTEDDDTSVWFDFAREMIEARAASKVLAKYVKDFEAAASHIGDMQDAERALALETARQAGTGRVRPTQF